MWGLVGATGQGMRVAPPSRLLCGLIGERMDAGEPRRALILPAIAGQAIWDFDRDGALNLSTAGEWILRPARSFWVSAKLWGGGGDNGPGMAGATGGGAGKVAGSIYLLKECPYRIKVAAAGADAFPGRGGELSALSCGNNYYFVAGGGGNAGFSSTPAAPSPGLAGSTAYSSMAGGSGSQDEGGKGGVGPNGTGANGPRLSGTLGTANTSGGAGGSGWFGGGQGGSNVGGGATGPGGGGSCFVHRLAQLAQVWGGSGRNPGDAADPDCVGAGYGGPEGGGSGSGGRVIIR